MISAILLSISLFGHGQLNTSSQHVAGWTLKITRDPYADQTSCSLRKGRVIFERHSLVFDFGAGTDTDNAFFRLDGGAPHSLSEVKIEDERNGFFDNGVSLKDPLAGRVVLPVSAVADAKEVSIRLSPKYGPHTFDVRGLADALAAAKSAGCGADFA